MGFGCGMTSDRVIVSDTFNRKNNDISLGIADTGQTWTNVLGTMGISSNSAVRIGSVSPAVSVVESGKSDVEISVTLTWNSNAGLVYRLTDESNYLLTRIMEGSFQMYRISNGAAHQFGEYSLPTTQGSVYSLRVIASGDRFFNYINGVLAISIQNPFNINATKHGITTRTADSTDAFDNFEVVSL